MVEDCFLEKASLVLKDECDNLGKDEFLEEETA